MMIAIKWTDFILTANLKKIEEVTGVSRVSVWRWKNFKSPPNKTKIGLLESYYKIKIVKDWS